MKRSFLIITIVGIAAIVALVIFNRQCERPCSFSGWQSNLGFDLEAKVRDADMIKGKLNISDEQLRDFDVLQKDFGAKYEALCRDHRSGVLTDAEYTCRRDNMDKALDAFRNFGVAVDAAKTLNNADVQGRLVAEAFERLREGGRARYATGCTSALIVSPKKITFTGNAVEQPIHITNGGSREIMYSVHDLPASFITKPSSGPLTKAAEATVSIYKLGQPPTEPGISRFLVTSDRGDSVEVELEISVENAAVYDRMSSEYLALGPADTNAGLHLAERAVPVTAINREAMLHLVAASMLLRAGNAAAADDAFKTAITKDPSLQKSPSALILGGVIQNRAGRQAEALQSLGSAAVAAGPADDDVRTAAVVLASSLTLGQGQTARAEAILSAPGANDRVINDLALREYAEREFNARELGALAVKARTEKEDN